MIEKHVTAEGIEVEVSTLDTPTIDLQLALVYLESYDEFADDGHIVLSSKEKSELKEMIVKLRKIIETRGAHEKANY